MSRDRSTSMWQSHKSFSASVKTDIPTPSVDANIEMSGGRLAKAELGKLQAMPKQRNAIPWKQRSKRGCSMWR